VLRGKWVFRLKRGPHSEVLRHKARLVVRGFEQKEGLDYNKTFATVVKPMSYKALFAFAAAQDWEIEQINVKTIFFYGDLDEEIYIEQPKKSENRTDRIYLLKKVLYELK
jgi:hypothetical protein